MGFCKSKKILILCDGLAIEGRWDLSLIICMALMTKVLRYIVSNILNYLSHDNSFFGAVS
jgi:hypothetical protein